jgi:hypothetical protein
MLGGLFEHVPETICFSDGSFFPGKKQNFWSLDYSPEVLDY